MKARDQLLFEAVGDMAPSPWLQESLRIGTTLPITSEKARSEFIVAPVLIECRERMQRRFNIYSGFALNADAEKGLNGECDFILARSASKFALQAPLMMIVEAKKHDIEENLGQGAAQMLGACRYNERNGKPLPYLYGCVTTGESWQFLKLQGNDLHLHPERFAIHEIGRILWFLMECLKDVDQLASEAA
ncbi:MAG: hypothetical protein HY289_03370 [Planctomycetes bacterium]|nr:hypothetical protein [Planctomycetota bacterium]